MNMKNKILRFRTVRWAFLVLLAITFASGLFMTGCDSFGRNYHTYAINQDSCISCLKCVPKCAYGAISHTKRVGTQFDSVVIDHKKCVGCGECIRVCPTAGAIKEAD